MAPVDAPSQSSSSSGSTSEENGGTNESGTTSSSSSSSSSGSNSNSTCDVCEEIDLSNGQSYEFAWTTDGTGCETPWTVCVGGSPLTDANSGCVKLSTNVEAGITKTGGIARVTAAHLQGLTSDNGTSIGGGGGVPR